jgi:hypothetical protein
MSFLSRSIFNASLAGLCFAAIGAFAQVSSINSAAYTLREFNDVPTATLTSVTDYNSLIVFDEHNVSASTGFANRDVWRFSNNGGTSAYQFQNNDFFQVSMTLQLTASPTSPRKEAGFLLSTIGGDGQFIVNSDAHEIVAFGGPLPFYAFPATYDSSEIITLGMTYFLDGGTGMRSIIYTANGVNSPILPLTNLEQGIIDGSRLGGYLQVVNAPGSPNNFGAAAFQNISITGVPEPSSFVLLGAGILPLLFRRRRI